MTSFDLVFSKSPGKCILPYIETLICCIRSSTADFGCQNLIFVQAIDYQTLTLIIILMLSRVSFSFFRDMICFVIFIKRLSFKEECCF